MANLIWVYNGVAPNFAEERERFSFGPCYEVFHRVNETYPHHKCFLVVNVSTYGEVNAAEHSAHAVETWRRTREANFIHVPIVVVDLARLCADADPFLYDPDRLCTGEVRANAAAIFNALGENGLIKPFSLTFMRGVLDDGHHVAKAIVAKELLAIVARFLWGGLTMDSRTVPHSIGETDIRGMRGTPEAYARLNLTDTNSDVVFIIAQFLNSIKDERRSGAPTLFYDQGGYLPPNLIYLWHHFPECFGLDFKLKGKNLCNQNHKILTFAAIMAWNKLYAFIRDRAEYTGKTEEDIKGMFTVPHIINRIDVFFNYAPKAYQGTLWAILEFTRRAPTNYQNDGMRLSEYNILMGYATIPPIVSELAWHITSASPPTVEECLFPLPPGVQPRAGYLTNVLYFPSFYRKIPEQSDPSWTPTGSFTMHVLFRNNGIPTALVKLVNAKWYHEPMTLDPTVSPRGSRRYPTFDPL